MAPVTKEDFEIFEKELAEKREAEKSVQEWSTPDEKADDKMGERLCKRGLMLLGFLVFAEELRRQRKHFGG